MVYWTLIWHAIGVQVCKDYDTSKSVRSKNSLEAFFDGLYIKAPLFGISEIREKENVRFLRWFQA